MKHVDIGIPANKKRKHSIGCLFWMLARMVLLQMRGTILPGHKWDITVDLFLYREADETKDHKEEDAPVAEYIAEYVAPSLLLPGDQWGADIPNAQWGSLNLVQSLLCLHWPCLTGPVLQVHTRVSWSRLCNNKRRPHRKSLESTKQFWIVHAKENFCSVYNFLVANQWSVHRIE